MSAFETNMIFKTQPSPPNLDLQVRVSPRLEINPKQLPFVMRDSMVMKGSPRDNSLNAGSPRIEEPNVP